MADASRSLRNATLRQLRVFGAVARNQSFTAAARELHLTQPAVSMQVKELEDACGAPLFERIGRSIHLTEAGAELAACAATVAEQLRQTEERLDALRGLKKGLLRLAAVSTAKYFAPSLLAVFQRAHPEVTVRFTVGNREEMIESLAANDADLVIMGRPPRELDTVAEPFATNPLVIVAAPGHPLARRRRIPLRRLAEETFLIRERGSGPRAAMERVFKDRAVPYRAGMEVASNETIKQAVIAGMGIAFLSAHTMALELAARKLVVLDVAGLPIVREWFVIHLKTKRLSPVAAAFRRFLVDHGARIIAGAATPD
jgi:DNA-binding transcriptional LysR family regulator